RGLALDLDGEVVPRLQARQQLRRQAHALEAADGFRRHVGRATSVVEQPEALEARPLQGGRVERRALGGEVTEAWAAAVETERDAPSGLADPVGPLPAELHRVLGAVA